MYSNSATERFLSLRAVAEEIEHGRRLPFQAKNMIVEMLSTDSLQAGHRKYAVRRALELGRANSDPNIRAIVEELAVVFMGFEEQVARSFSDWQRAFAQAAADDSSWHLSVRDRALMDARFLQDIKEAHAKTLPFVYPYLFPEHGVLVADRHRQNVFAEISSLELAAAQGRSQDGSAAQGRLQQSILELRDATQDIRSQAGLYLAATKKLPESTSEERARKRHLSKLLSTYPIVADHEDAFADMFDGAAGKLGQISLISWSDAMKFSERRSETLREISRSLSAAINVIDLN